MFKFQFSKSEKDGQWRWHLVHQNGKIVADSSEGYHNKLDCQNQLINIIHFIAKELASVNSAGELMKQIIEDKDHEQKS